MPRQSCIAMKREVSWVISVIKMKPTAWSFSINNTCVVIDIPSSILDFIIFYISKLE